MVVLCSRWKPSSGKKEDASVAVPFFLYGRDSTICGRRLCSQIGNMERQISHRHASISGGDGMHALSLQKKKPPKLVAQPLPKSSCLQRDLMSMSFPDLLKVAKQLKRAGVVTSLRLFVSLNEQHIVNQRFSSLDPRTTDAVFEFTRALSRAIEGWMHDVEIGLSLWNRDLKILSEAFGYSKTLRRLSFANSGLGDVRLEIMADGLRDCVPLQTLDLSGCALTDASVRCISTIVKSAVTRKAELEWKASLREPMGRRNNRQDNGHRANKVPVENLALSALDLSYNAFTDLLPRELVVPLRMGAPLHALNLRFNQLTRVGAKCLLDVMQEFNILRLVDLRGNEDEKLLGVLENGEHYTSSSTFQAPFWLDSLLPPSTNDSNSDAIMPQKAKKKKKKKRDSRTVTRSKHHHPNQQSMRSIHLVNCNLAAGVEPSTTSTGHQPANPKPAPLSNIIPGKIQTPISPSPEELTTEDGTPGMDSTARESEEASIGTNILRIEQPLPKRPQTAAERRIVVPALIQPELRTRACEQDRLNRGLNSSASSGAVPLWDQDWPCSQGTTPPGMIDPPREVVIPEPPKMFFNELYEMDEESNPTDNACDNVSLRLSSVAEKGKGDQPRSNCAGRFRAERVNNKRKIPDSLKRRSRKGGRKSPPPTKELVSRAKNNVGRDHHVVRHQKKSKKSLQEKGVMEEQKPRALASSQPEDAKKEVEWHKFVTEMTETLLTLRDGLDRLIGPTEDDTLSVAQHGANSKLPQNFIGPGMSQKLEPSCQALDSQAKPVHQGPNKALKEWKLVGNAHPQVDVRKPCGVANQSKRICNPRMRF